MIRRLVRAARCAAFALTALATLGVAPAFAYGIPTYTIYVDGPFGGTIETSGGAEPLPPGACGLRLTNANALAWYWYEGDIWPQDVMNVDNNGWFPPNDQLMWLLEFTGPFGEGCGSPYTFHTPATPDGEPPAGAIALVIQFVDVDKVEFLDFDFDVYEPPEIPDPDPPIDDPEDVCEMVPEFCEIPDSLVEDPCHHWDWTEICDSGEEGGRLMLGVGRIVEPRVLGLATLAGAAADGPRLRAALARTADAMSFGPLVAQTLERWLTATDGRLRATASRKAASEVLVGVGLASRELQRCQDGLRAALRLAGSTTTTPNRALAAAESRARIVCDAASASFADASAAAIRFTIALRSER
jgi:hypothetical protein